MSKFEGPEYLPGIISGISFFPADEQEVKAWAKEHAKSDWTIQKSVNDHVYTLLFTHKEGDTAVLPFTYIWDGEKIVKSYHEERSKR